MGDGGGRLNCPETLFNPARKMEDLVAAAKEMYNRNLSQLLSDLLPPFKKKKATTTTKKRQKKSHSKNPTICCNVFHDAFIPHALQSPVMEGCEERAERR